MKDSLERSECTTGLDCEAAHHDQETGRKHVDPNVPADSTRRSFIARIGGTTAVALAVGIPLEPLFEGKHGEAEASVVRYGAGARTNASFEYRKNTAEAERIDVGELPDNGDSHRFTDYSGNWSKCLMHDGLGVPDAASYLSRPWWKEPIFCKAGGATGCAILRRAW